MSKNPAWDKFLSIIYNAPFIAPAKIRFHEHYDYGAINGGHACQIVCEADVDLQEIFGFAEKNTPHSDWLMKDKQYNEKEKFYIWTLIRYDEKTVNFERKTK